MNTKPACTARELVPFALIAFGLPFLMGVPLGMAQRAGYATDAFANFLNNTLTMGGLY